MKKLSRFLTCSLATLFLSITPTGVANADDESILAEGRWTYEPEVIVEWDETLVGDAIGFVYVVGHEIGTWTGTFEGSSYDVFLLKDYRPEEDKVELPYGEIFFEGSVDGKNGTLIISFAPGEKSEGEWSGDWEILGGTGGLKKLRGEGRWEGPSRDLEYWGEIYFLRGR
jgi:hypothetical protein